MTNPIEAPGPAQMPVSQPVLLKALRWGAVVTIALIAIFAGIGYLVAGTEGLIGGVFGTAMGGVFLGLTVGSIAFANRFVENPAYIVMFFAIVMGAWLLKFVIFIVLLILLRDQPWLDGPMLFFGLLASVIAALTIDVLLVTRSRLPITNLPE